MGNSILDDGANASFKDSNNKRYCDRHSVPNLPPPYSSDDDEKVNRSNKAVGDRENRFKTEEHVMGKRDPQSPYDDERIVNMKKRKCHIVLELRKMTYVMIQKTKIQMKKMEHI